MASDDQDQSQKTEEPTPRRLEQARKKGDVAKSPEIAGWLVLAVSAALVAAASGPMSRFLAQGLSVFLAQPHALSVEPRGLIEASVNASRTAMLALLGPIAALLVAGIVGHLIQSGLLVSGEKIKPKLSKLSPLEGVKRIFGPAGAANFGKGVGKIVLVSGAAVVTLWPRREELAALPALPAEAGLILARDATVAFLIAALVIYGVVAALDYAGQRHSFFKRQRMSRQDVKDEHKQSDGDPHVKARLRQIRMERARRRMIAAVPDATVVITNPTHYAVALRYEQGETPAPICVAKGVDAVALAIRGAATEADVPIVEDPPLARALHAGVELDQPIPAEHFAAVAKIIGYILSVARERS